jgi:hypothetical protein
MVGIAENVGRAASSADLDAPPSPVLPFPGNKGHRDRYVAELAELLLEYRRAGFRRQATRAR